jgi:hypothetical protein
MTWFLLPIPIIDEDCPATGTPAGFNVSPAVPDQKARGKVDRVPPRCLQQQTWKWLAAIAVISGVVITDKKVI